MALTLPLALLLSGCSSIRPVVKIGLIAPFEELYRQSGYAALDAMRQAITECAPAGMDVLPLALDDGGDPEKARRVAQKLLVDPTVRAIVGPLQLSEIPAVSSVISATTPISWYIPPLVAPAGGFASPTESNWIDAQVTYVAANSAAKRVLLLGLPDSWRIQAQTDVPVLQLDTLAVAQAELQEGDAVLWLGAPDVGARWFTQLHNAMPTLEFWLANQTGLEIFAAHSTDHQDVHWLLWLDPGYNQWSKSNGTAISPGDVTRYQTYRATCAALNELGPQVSTQDASAQDQRLNAVPWELQSRLLPQ